MKLGAVAGKLAVSFLVAVPLSACVLGDPDDLDDSDEYDDLDLEEEIGETTQEVLTANGMSLNGMSLNGMSLNGMSLNGMSLNGMSLNGMSLNGSQLSGVKSNGTADLGRRLRRCEDDRQLASGGTVSLRVDSAQTAARAQQRCVGLRCELPAGRHQHLVADVRRRAARWPSR